MFNFASKVVFLFIEPSSLVLILLVLSWFARKSLPRLARAAFVTAILIFYILGCPTTSNWLVHMLESKYADRGIRLSPTAQAIVVLGGSLNRPNQIHTSIGVTDSSDRLLTAVRLYHAGKAPIVVASGGDNPLVKRSGIGHESDEMRALLEEWGVPDSAILVEDASINTHENALLTRRLLASKQINHILLVTSAMHMPRAVASFQKAGFDVDADPADFRTGWGDSASLFGWIPSPGALGNSTELVHECVGLLIYRLRGWI